MTLLHREKQTKRIFLNNDIIQKKKPSNLTDMKVSFIDGTNNIIYIYHLCRTISSAPLRNNSNQLIMYINQLQ